MVSWRACSFECPDAGTVEAFSEWLSDYGLVEFPEDVSATEMAVLRAREQNDDDVKPADAALLGNMFYTHSVHPKEDLIADSVRFWDRAATVQFDATTETAVEATLYRDVDGTPESVVTYEGTDGYGGMDLAYRFVVEHDFQFRCYAVDSPSMAHVTPIPGAEDRLTLGDDTVEELASVTGVEATGEARERLQE